MKNATKSITAALLLSLATSSAFSGSFTVNLDSSGNTYGVKNGRGSTVEMGLTLKQATRLARQLNRTVKQDDKAAARQEKKENKGN